MAEAKQRAETKNTEDKANETRPAEKKIAPGAGAKEKKQKQAQPAPIQTKKKEPVYAIRGNIFEGKVISAKANKTVTVERLLTQYLPKYERYKKVRSRIKAHNPESVAAKEGDWVRAGETRRISKTKSFIVMEVIKTHKK